jgi:hypothetical protein
MSEPSPQAVKPEIAPLEEPEIALLGAILAEIHYAS